MQDDYVSTEHLLLGLAAAGKPVTFQQFLKNFGLTQKKVKEAILNVWRAESNFKNPGEFLPGTQKIWHRFGGTSQSGQTSTRSLVEIQRFAGSFVSFLAKQKIIPC